MRILDNDERTPRPAQASPTTGGGFADPAALRTAPVITDDEAPPRSGDETIFSVLAGRARSRPLAHLWITAVIGAVDAVALAIARPGLWWVAAACAAVSGYATWGIADRAFDRLDGEGRRGAKGVALRLVRVLAIAIGLVGVVATVIGFLGVSVGKTGPPG